MSDKYTDGSCNRNCWLVSAAIGVITAILLMAAGHYAFLEALILGGLLFVILGFIFVWLFCNDVPQQKEASSPAIPVSAPVASASAAPVAAAPAPSTPGVVAEPEPAAAPEEPAAVDATLVKASAPLAGQDDLAARKGEWKYEADVGSSDVDASASENLGTEDAVPAEVEPEAEPVVSEPAAADLAVDPVSVMKPSAALPGQAELATRKGTWKYEAGTASETPAVAELAEPVAAAASVVEDDAAGDGQLNADRDGDGVAEGEDEGVKPAGLTAAREGGPDDLKRIKGIGPKLEKLCQELGFYHFDQISAWTASEVAWVDANLKGFRGRVTRDNWVEQARLLATGGETEFSKRVDKGGVY